MVICLILHGPVGAHPLLGWTSCHLDSRPLGNLGLLRSRPRHDALAVGQNIGESIQWVMAMQLLEAVLYEVSCACALSLAYYGVQKLHEQILNP